MGILERTKHTTRVHARAILSHDGVRRVTRAEYYVRDPGSEKENRVYKAYGSWRCASCQGGRTERNPCKDILAVLGTIYDIELEPTKPGAYKSKEKRDWTARRQANESWATFFQWAVQQIADTLETDEGPPRRGRRAHTIRDQFIQAITWKEAANVNMQEARGRTRTYGFTELMDQAPSYSYVSKFLGLPQTQTLIEKWLLATTLLAEPYEEPEVAIDGTYFTNLHRTNPPREREGIPIRSAARRLAIPITTYRWNLVPAVAVPDTHAEAPWTLPLFHRTMTILDLRQVAADRGYPFKEFALHAERHGYEIVMPFRRGTGISNEETPEALAFNRLVAQRAVAPAKYWQSNQKRKNAEAQNSSTKAKFGQILRCRKPIQQANEIRLQYLILNLKRLCQLSAERGATYDFRLAWRHIDHLPWLSLEELHDMLNGPNRLRYIQTLDPRAVTFDHADAAIQAVHAANDEVPA